MLESTEGYTLDVGVGALGEFGMFDGELEMWSRTFTIRRGQVKSAPAAAVAAADAAATSATERPTGSPTDAADAPDAATTAGGSGAGGGGGDDADAATTAAGRGGGGGGDAAATAGGRTDAPDAATTAGGGGGGAAAAATTAGGSDSPCGGTAVTLRVFEDPSEAGTNGEYILWPSSVMMARFLQLRGEEK